MATSKTLKAPNKTAAFVFNAPDALAVALAGSFNSWDVRSTLLKKDKDGVWKKEIYLKPGRYEYKFVVDGNWTVDPGNKNRTRNKLGTENSLVEIK